MAGSVNQVILVGRLAADPETRETKDKKSVAVTFRIATKEKWKDDKGDYVVQYHRIVVWNQRIANYAMQFLTKGSLVYVSGCLKYRDYKDKKGVDKKAIEIEIGGFYGSLEHLVSSNEAAPEAAEQTPNEASYSLQKPIESGIPPDLDDDLPF